MGYLRLLHIFGTQQKSVVMAISMLLILSSCGADRNIKKGDKYLSMGEYYNAATQFKTAYQRTPPKERRQRGLIATKLAACYDRISSYQSAIAAYRNIIRYKLDNVKRIRSWLTI